MTATPPTELSPPWPRAPFVLLSFPRAHGDGAEILLLQQPARVLVASTLDGVLPLLDEVERAAMAGMYAAGMVSYEAAPAFDGALRVRSREDDLPLAWFVVASSTESIAPAALDVPVAGGPDASPPWLPNVSRDEYDATIATIRGAIERGDVYQVNHTLRLRAPAPADRLAFWQRMRHAQPDAYAAFLDLGDHQILSVSPELFFERQGRAVVTRPMKGTARRGRWLEEDDARAAQLAASEKERAENVMIVDLLRNDLGRIARAGTVRVERLFDVERHPTVLQMTSTVGAELKDDVTLADMFTALFPCGSVTGAPKVAASAMIAALERSPRGAYCGAIGIVRPGGDCTFNVAIRTAQVDTRHATMFYGAGGGITWDSHADAEFDELLAKAAVVSEMRPEFALLETMRREHGRIVRVDRHLSRLRDSARYFGFPPAVVSRAADALARLPAQVAAAQRVRLLAHRDGQVELSCTPGPLRSGEGGVLLPVRLASKSVHRDDPFLHHKTTHRAVYDARRAECDDAFDVLLWNEQEEATEFTIGNLVVELEGVCCTPPRDCGLLAGTLRGELLERGAIVERVLPVESLRRATRLWLVNSLRGMVPVTLSVT